MKKKIRQSVNVDSFEDEYAYNDSIWSEDEEDIAAIKKIVSELPDEDRKLILLYAETASLRATSKQLGVSLTITSFEINRIKQVIKNKFYNR